MFFNTQRLGVAPHLVELADQLDGLFGGLALAGNVQVDELVPGGTRQHTSITPLAKLGL